MSDAPNIDAMATLVQTAVRVWDGQRARSVQARSGQIGPSSLGFCRQHALLTMQDVAATDADDTWAAVLGTLIGAGIEDAVSLAKPGWSYQVPLSCTLKRGNQGVQATISGHADIVDPDTNTVWDVKTKDGFGWVRREPWSQNYLFQTWVYVQAALQAGILDKDRPAYQGLIYVDRSGGESRPFVTVREWLPSVEDEIVDWVDDVIYAHIHGEDAQRDIPAPVCERICEKFTACRGGLPDKGALGVYEDPFLIDSVRAYRQAVTDEKEAKQLKDAARANLAGVEGIVDGMQVRWTHVDSTFVPGYEKHGFDRIDVRKARGR